MPLRSTRVRTPGSLLCVHASITGLIGSAVTAPRITSAPTVRSTTSCTSATTREGWSTMPTCWVTTYGVRVSRQASAAAHEET